MRIDITVSINEKWEDEERDSEDGEDGRRKRKAVGVYLKDRRHGPSDG